MYLNETEAIKIDNWKYSNNKLGSNYILLKKYQTSVDLKTPESSSSIFNNLFSLKMDNLFEFNQIDEGEYSVNTYSSINSPLVVDFITGEYFLPTIGIVIDKTNVTFFYFKEEVVYSQNKKTYSNNKVITGKGKFKVDFNAQNYNYTSSSQNVGFLNQIVKVSGSINLELYKYSAQGPDTNIINFLSYSKTNDFTENENEFGFFNSITFTHQEFQILKAEQDEVSGDFPNHSKYLTQKDESIIDYDGFSLVQHNVTLSEVFIEEDESDTSLVTINMKTISNDILIDDLPISLSAIIK